jgi:hypothetical protein
MPYLQTREEEIETANTPPEKGHRHPWLWNGKVVPAFWTIASVISMIVNIILIVVLILLANQLFTLKALVQNQLLGGLYANFQKMDDAHIRTTIPVSAEVPAKFDLPLHTKTTVTLTEDTTVNGMTIYNFYAGNTTITQAQANIVLPAGTSLPIELNLVVPVDQKIPVKLNVNVDIPLNQTDLHQPFTGLQEVVKPYYTLLDSLPGSWQDVMCKLVSENSCTK